MPIGLDGTYRLIPGEFGLPQGMRGYWSDEETFVLEHDQIANNEHFIYQIHFAGEGILIEGTQTAHELGISVRGMLQKP
jgi:hypothetical protein